MWRVADDGGAESADFLAALGAGLAEALDGVADHVGDFEVDQAADGAVAIYFAALLASGVKLRALLRR